VYIQDTKNFNKEACTENLMRNLSELNYDNSLGNVNHNMAKFMEIFHNILNSHAPLRKQTRKERILNSKPWLTKEILQLIRHKNKLYTACVKGGNCLLWVEYKNCKNNLTHIKENAKKGTFKI